MQNTQINWPFIGNTHVTSYLNKALAGNKLGHCYIFNGIGNIGKTTAVLNFTKVLMCETKDKKILPCNNCRSCTLINKNIHNDITILSKDSDKKNIKTEQVRDFIHSLGLSSFLNKYKIGIIKNINSLNINGFNALLKTLEEPNKDTIILLTSNDLNSIPKTILSRSIILNFKSVDQNLIYDFLVNNHNINRDDAKNISRICLGRPALALKFSQDLDFLSKELNQINIFLDTYNIDIAQRFKIIDSLIEEKLSPQEQNKQILKLIERWQVVARDLYLYKYGQKKLIQHDVLNEKLDKISQKISILKITQDINLLKKAKQYLKSNVAAKNTLEHIFINI